MSLIIAPAYLDSESKKLKRDVEEWREILLSAFGLLTWQQPFAPAIIAGSVTSLFIFLWFLDPSVITVVAGLWLFVAIMDYLVPVVSAQVFKPDAWTAAKERELENVCKVLAANKIYVTRGFKSYIGLRNERPKLFYMLTISALLFLTWLGNVLDNLFLSYLIVMAMVMTPGLKQKGILAPLFEMLGQWIPHATSNELKQE